MKHNDWTQQLHDRLSDHKASVPDGLWDNIESKLDMPAKKRSNVFTVHLAKWIGAAAAILLLVVGTYHINRDTINTLNQQPTAAAVQKNSAISATGEPSVATENVASAVKVGLAKAAKSLVGSTHMAESNANEGVLAQNALVATSPEWAVTVTDEAAQNTDATSSESKTATNDRQTAQMHTHNGQSNGTQQATTPTYTSRPASRGKTSGWSFGVHTGNIMTESRQTSMPTPMQRSYTVKGTDADVMVMSSYPLQIANYRESHHHNIPVSVGATASYGLGKRVALTTGLVYTRATSDFIQSSGSDDICETQILHYIGVPLSASYKLFSTGRLHAYVTAGAQADFNVSATLKTEEVSVGIKKDRPQFSVNAAAGVEYDIIPQLGLYAEPGVRYYIDNQSSIDNIFKDKPCNFSLQVGIRFNVK